MHLNLLLHHLIKKRFSKFYPFMGTIPHFIQGISPRALKDNVPDLFSGIKSLTLSATNGGVESVSSNSTSEGGCLWKTKGLDL